MSQIELVPYTELLDSELRAFAASQVEMFELPGVRDAAADLTLNGLVRRYTAPEKEVFAHARAARNAMAAETLAAYAVRPITESGQPSPSTVPYIGSASRLPAAILPLREQPFGLGPRYARAIAKRVPGLGAVISREVEGLDENAVAWIDPRRAGHVAETSDAQKQLVALASPAARLWRIIPRRVVRRDEGPAGWGSAMRAAGYREMLRERDHFDDMEVKGAPSAAEYPVRYPVSCPVTMKQYETMCNILWLDGIGVELYSIK